MIGYHRVESVHHLIPHHCRHSTDGKPEEWGDDSIAEILGKCFECSLAHFLVGEFRCVATYDARHLSAALVERAVDGIEHLTHLADECGAGKTITDQYHAHCPTDLYINSV